MRAASVMPEAETAFSGMTKAQMLEYAEENGITDVNGRMTKAEIMEVLQNA